MNERQSGVPEIVRNLREFAGVLARGGVRVAKPPTATETRRPAARSSARWLAPEVCEHREHAAVRLWTDRQTEFEEHLLDVRLDGALRDEQSACDRAVGQALRHEAQHLALARGELGERVVPALPPDEAGDDCRVGERGEQREGDQGAPPRAGLQLDPELTNRVRPAARPEPTQGKQRVCRAFRWS